MRWIGSGTLLPDDPQLTRGGIPPRPLVRVILDRRLHAPPPRLSTLESGR
jgi:riboflavin biosynthesis pyrimidine reductase